MSHDEERTRVRRLFVYGSLRRGECNHDVWLGAGATPVVDGYIARAELVSLGDYCTIVPVDDPARTVIGEVYDLAPDVFDRIEAMEAEADYVRKPVEVHHGSDGARTPGIPAEAYFYSMPERLADRPRIASGDWSLRKRSGPRY
jgi:gamma-glutamylcyclotransferase (GGCT)/AIG2-like uncharacterized protein YtfP